MSDPLTTDERLFGLPGAERCYDDPAGVYESEIDPWIDETGQREWAIEEWSVRPPIDHIPSALTILESILERIADDGELSDEFGFDSFERAAKRDDVVQAIEGVRELIAAKVTWRQADKLLATHTVTFDANGDPLFDGEPLYVKAPAAGNERRAS